MRNAGVSISAKRNMPKKKMLRKLSIPNQTNTKIHKIYVTNLHAAATMQV